ncbi:hypothetical protein CONPUDRAFT_74984 [Coniophora puteana RWD-64-598 SS2]|uniref:Uncharacterized protein n=1 Tax=Coniophora puteana (strain RWD-64-598) TaxID=741705 RepID=A0A5M3MGQ9_CONPW|nr:uncharacterized protein CONPUDRAFT_74984 [Coniophora puteana RWD-64-598 SS2]EIW78247.1 hypothetical protein CONPUDRAFT_74984 [Coniophora puteana RWD-64-598 SS2]
MFLHARVRDCSMKAPPAKETGRWAWRNIARVACAQIRTAGKHGRTRSQWWWTTWLAGNKEQLSARYCCPRSTPIGPSEQALPRHRHQRSLFSLAPGGSPSVACFSALKSVSPRSWIRIVSWVDPSSTYTMESTSRPYVIIIRNSWIMGYLMDSTAAERDMETYLEALEGRCRPRQVAESHGRPVTKIIRDEGPVAGNVDGCSCQARRRRT